MVKGVSAVVIVLHGDEAMLVVVLGGEHATREQANTINTTSHDRDADPITPLPDPNLGVLSHLSSPSPAVIGPQCLRLSLPFNSL